MKRTSGIAALAGVLFLVCLAVAWEWYVHIGKGRPVAQPVQQIAAATPAVAPTPTPSPAAVTYVPQAVPTASSPPSAPPAATASAATAGPAASKPAPTPTVSPTPYTAGGSSAISNEPMVAATLAPHAASVKPLLEAPDAPPRILAMSLSTPVAHGGDIVSGTVETSSNVASVEARIAGYSSTMQKVGMGRFALTYRVPNLPFFLHRTYTIEVIARNSRGDAVRSSVPITVR
ncbi:MAG TPA: hypothetical protein VFN37_12700 [Candidatus Baltobacteraceae bacterium]|nr:hypothetical protein [Candidatus Baltobacteraceae bacterium]